MPLTLQIADAIQTNPGFLALRQIEIARDVAQHVGQSQGKVYLDSDTLLLNSLGKTQFGPRPSFLFTIAEMRPRLSRGLYSMNEEAFKPTYVIG
jgi:hypothetical protein